jgi:hypothetical protein
MSPVISLAVRSKGKVEPAEALIVSLPHVVQRSAIPTRL